MGIKVCHLTSAHKSNDTRIFHKQCVSLAKNGYEVYLVANGDSYKQSGVQVVGIESFKGNRIKRMIQTTRKVYNTAKKINADIYHIHDPELLPYALKLKRLGKKVVFDSHEDYVSTILDKGWLPKFSRAVVRLLYTLYEGFVINKIDGAVVCYHWTEERYNKHNQNVKMVLNFPIVSNSTDLANKEVKSRSIAFAGGISSQWCHKEILGAINNIENVTFELAGNLKGKYGEEVQKLAGWNKVNYHGVIQHEEVFSKVYSKSIIGMALLDYISQCKGTIGNLSNTKFFEYMYVGLPLICTDFVLWKKIIDEEDCGIYVNPHDENAIAKAIRYLLDNPNRARKMGENGRKAVLSKYNWNLEEKKLLELYSNIQ